MRRGAADCRKCPAVHATAPINAKMTMATLKRLRRGSNARYSSIINRYFYRNGQLGITLSPTVKRLNVICVLKCRLLAPNGHPNALSRCPPSGVKRTSVELSEMSAFEQLRRGRVARML